MCCSAAPMPASTRCEMSPPDGAATIRAIVDRAKDVPPRLSPFSAAEFLQLDLPPRELILDPILPQKGLMLLHAYRGIGKTLVGLAIGYCVATGGQLLGWTAEKARKVLYVDGEMPAETMQARLAAIIAGAGKQPPDPSYFQILSADLIEGGLPDLAMEAGQREIDAAIARAEPDLIIIDNCSTLIRSGKETRAGSRCRAGRWRIAELAAALSSSTTTARPASNAGHPGARTYSTP
jgi:putative DNA primase/helicase